jgi:hypothetical protein
MPIKTVCPRCGTPYTLADDVAGSTVRCRECREAFPVGLRPPREDRFSPRESRSSRPAGRRERDIQSGGSGASLGLVIGLVIAGVFGLVVVVGVVGIFWVAGSGSTGSTPGPTSSADPNNPPGLGIFESGGQPPVEPPWRVVPDPGPDWTVGLLPADPSIPTAFFSAVAYPSSSAPFVAVNLPRDGKQFQVHDLANWRPVGQPQSLELPTFVLPVLSPDGQELAFPVKADRPTVEVRSVQGRSLRIEADADPSQHVGWVDFAGRDRVITMTQPGQFPLPSAEGRYRVWNTATGKKEVEFSFNLLFSHKWGALSPGRNQLVLQQTGGGYRLLFWNLRTGEQVGTLEFQRPTDPWGQASGLAFSNDGRYLAMLWRLGEKPNRWGRLLCWDLTTRQKVHDHEIGYVTRDIDSLWFKGGKHSLQWMPDGNGWLLFGHLIVRRQDGAIIGRVPPEPNSLGPMERVFVGRDHITSFTGGLGPKVSVVPLPKP